MTADTFSTGPAGVVARIQHQGQSLAVVKLQDGLHHSPALADQLRRLLGLAPGAPLLVLHSDGSEPDQGPAHALYHDYLSTNTSAVADVVWQPLA